MKYGLIRLLEEFGNWEIIGTTPKKETPAKQPTIFSYQNSMVQFEIKLHHI